MPKILVVDDEQKILNIFEQLLTDNGFEVVTANGGKEGLKELTSAGKYDALILDLGMPELNGSDILKKMMESKIKTPTLIITGSFDIEKYSYALENAGVSPEFILYKPVDLYVLLEKVKTLLLPQ